MGELTVTGEVNATDMLRVMHKDCTFTHLPSLLARAAGQAAWQHTHTHTCEKHTRSNARIVCASNIALKLGDLLPVPKRTSYRSHNTQATINKNTNELLDLTKDAQKSARVDLFLHACELFLHGLQPAQACIGHITHTSRGASCSTHSTEARPTRKNECAGG